MLPVDPSAATARAQGWLLAVDPGMRFPAAAVFLNGRLTDASRVKVPGALAKLPVGERCRQVVTLVCAWASARMREGYPSHVVVEHPQVYSRRRSKGDPNDLLPLAMINGGVAMYFRAPVISPTPSEWIGGIPKAAMGDPWASPRGRLLQSRLSELERATIVSTHDALDAVGIGLWALGRLGRVFPDHVA